MPIFWQITQKYPFLAASLAAINLATFFLYGLDKLFARAGTWRVRERTLLVLALLGGSLGALLAMYLFRHKTKKPFFGLLFVIILLLQIALLVFIFQNASPGPITAY